MATLRTKIDRFYRKNSSINDIVIVDNKGEKLVFNINENHKIPSISDRFCNSKVKCYGLNSLEKFFPNLLGKEVIDTKELFYCTHLYVDYNFAEYINRIYKYIIFDYTRKMTPEKRKIANSLQKLVNADIKQLEKAFTELQGCDKYDIRALTSVVYCLENGIKATKGTLAYGAQRVWKELGKEAIWINKNSTYCFRI